VTETGSGTGYDVVAKSKSNGGARTFTIKHVSGVADVRSCTPDGGGCNGSSW
jgi:hypothetical protein